MRRSKAGDGIVKLVATTEAETPPSVADDDRRTHRRLEIRMPIEVAGCEDHGLVRTITRNICTGGFYVELDHCEFAPGEEVRIEMTVPAGDGVSSFPARARCRGRIARIDKIRLASPRASRIGVAIRFLDRLRFAV